MPIFNDQPLGTASETDGSLATVPVDEPAQQEACSGHGIIPATIEVPALLHPRGSVQTPAAGCIVRIDLGAGIVLTVRKGLSFPIKAG